VLMVLLVVNQMEVGESKAKRETTDMIKVGDKVETVWGIHKPGVVVAKFKKIDAWDKEERLVVECTEPAVAGMLRIFREGELKKTEPKSRFRGWI